MSMPTALLVCRLFEARFWHLVLLAAVAANAGSWLDTTILATNVWGKGGGLQSLSRGRSAEHAACLG